VWRRPKAKERPAIGRPRHLKYAWLPLVSFDAQSGMEATAGAQVVNYLLDSSKKQLSLCHSESFPIAPETRIHLVCGH
jgi:hypothetical protein